MVEKCLVRHLSDLKQVLANHYQAISSSNGEWIARHEDDLVLLSQHICEGIINQGRLLICTTASLRFAGDFLASSMAKNRLVARPRLPAIHIPHQGGVAENLKVQADGRDYTLVLWDDQDDEELNKLLQTTQELALPHSLISTADADTQSDLVAPVLVSRNEGLIVALSTLVALLEARLLGLHG